VISKRGFPYISLTAPTTGKAMLVIVFCIAGATLGARLLHVGMAPVIESNSTWMRAVTAVCLLLCGAALAFLRGAGPQPLKSAVARTAGIVVGAVALLTLLTYLVEIFSGHESPLAQWPIFLFMVTPFRMSIITAILFLLFAGVLLLLGRPGRRAATAAHTALLPIALITYFVLIGYLFKVQTLYEWLYPAIALSSGIAFLALTLAAFTLRPDSWITETFSGDKAGAIMARRLLPAIVLLPVIVGWLRIQGERHGLFSSEVGVSMVAIAYTIFFSVFVWFTARSVNRADRKRRIAVEDLRKSEAAIRLKLNSILSPEGDIGDLELADIIDAPGIQKLMDKFNELSGIPMAIIDLKGVVLVGTGWQQVCTGFHRVNPDSCRNCIESDTELSKEIPAGEFKLYKCKNHMWDMATPIIVGGKKMGNLFMGQFFFEEDTIDYDLFRGQANRYRFDEREYLAALDTVPRLSRKTIESGKEFFIRLADMLSQASFSNVKLARSLTQADSLAQSLRESQSLLNAVMDTTPDPVFVKDCKSRLLLANPATLAAFGKPSGEVIGRTDEEAYNDKAAGRAIMENDRKAMESGQTVVVEELIPSPGGDRIYLSSKTPMRDADGAVIGLIGIARDITERKRAEEALRLSEARLNLFVEFAPAAIAMLDCTMHYLSASRRWFSDYGLKEADIIGRSHYEIFPDVPERWKEIHRRCLAGAVESCAEDPFPRQDGHIDWIDWEIRPWYRNDDTIGGIIIFSQNVTERRQLMDALRQSEERFSLALKNAPVAVAVQDRDLRFLWSYNPQSIAPEELLGKTDADIFAPTDAAILGALKRKVLASGVEHREQLWVTSNGKRMFLDLFLEPIHDAAGLIAGVGVATVDYTQLKNTEEALQRMVKRFELLTDTASELLSAREPQEIIESLCCRVIEHLDCHVFFNFLVDNQAGKLRLNACAGIPEAEAARIEWLDFGVAVCGCAAQEGCRIVAEHIPTTPDPRTDLVKSYGVKAYAAHPLKSENGAVIGTLSFGTRSRETFSNDDLYLMKAVADRVATAMTRQRTDQELRKYNRMLKALSKSSQAMTKVKNEDQYLQEVCRIVVEDCGHALVWVGFAENDEARTVRPAASAGFEGGYLENLNITWDETDRGQGPTGTAIRTGKVGMCRNMATDPAFLPWRAQAAKHGFSASIVLPLMEGTKAFGALTIYSREVDPFSDDEVRLLTELADDLASGIVTIRSAAARARAEQALGVTAEELSRSNKDLEMFAYAASHDLQEPLRAVAGFMGIIKKQYENKLDSEGREYIEYAVEGAERMQRLIHDLLTYSRVGTRGTAFRPSSAREALDAALYNLRLSIEESGAVVTCDSLPVIAADRTQMTQVFQNLIGNALKFRSERTPAIAVSAMRENDSWVFRIEDNGIGIEPQYFDRIFIIFQRLHSREQYDGTGIGLAVVKKIIERHSGRIWVESTCGKGSTFYFTIPDRGAMYEYSEFPTDSNIAG
jgi:PAS domain S-box-containing protein